MCCSASALKQLSGLCIQPCTNRQSRSLPYSDQDLTCAVGGLRVMLKPRGSFLVHWFMMEPRGYKLNAHQSREDRSRT